MSKLGFSKTSRKRRPLTTKSSDGATKPKISKRVKAANSSGPQKQVETNEGGSSSELLKEVKGQKSIKPAMKGIGLTPRLMLWITSVAIFVTIVVGSSIASQIRLYVKDEILKSGVTGVQQFASLGRVLIKENIDLKVKKDTVESFLNVNEFKTAINIKTESARLIDMIKKSGDGIETPIMDGYITLIELKGEDKIISILGDQKKGDASFPPGELVGQEGDVKITSTELTLNGKTTPVYIFELDISRDIQNLCSKFEEGYRAKEGKVRLFLSSAKIQESADSVFFMTSIILLGAVFVSMLISFFLSRGITKPILKLVEDMSIVAGGDLEHETKSTSSDEIGYLSATFNQLTRSLKTAHEAEIEKEKLEHDMSVGREIQQTLLPKSLYKIPGYDLDAFYLSAKEVGGDYFDLIAIDKSKLGVIVADVSGKGIQGAMIMTIMRTVMNIAAVGNLSCKNCLGRTNRFLADRIKRGMFVTAFYVILDCRKHKLLFSSAGHNPMLIYRAATKKIEQYNPTGIALGFDKGPLFERTLKEAEEVLRPGDRFVLYTDGVVESMNEDHEEFTDARFEEFVMANAEEDSKTFIHKLVAELKKHQGKAPQHDDITIVTFRRNS